MINGYKIVALCLSKVSIPINHEFVSELNSLLVENGCRLFIYNTCSDLYDNDNNFNPECVVYDLIDYEKTDAIIIVEQDIKNDNVVGKLCANAKKHNIPALIVDGSRDDAVNVCFDYEGGFEKTVRHIIEFHKVKKPHFLAGIEGNEFSEHRLDAFKKVLAENGIAFDKSMVSYGDFWAEPARKAAEKIAESGNIPEALICANDVMAINAVNVFLQHGLSVPDDIIVSGFDGVLEAFSSVPRITTCMCSFKKLAVKIAELLRGYFEGKELPHYNYVETSPVLSESCGCSRGNELRTTSYLTDLSNHFYNFESNYRMLSRMTEAMQNCTDVSKLPEILENNGIWGICCAVNQNCIDRSVNAVAEHTKDSLDDEMFIIFNNVEGSRFVQRTFPRSEINPSLDLLFERKCPLVFNIISSVQKPIGYICFYFTGTNIVDYGTIQQTVMILGIGLGGFISMQHERYLAEMVEESYKTDTLTGLYNRRAFSRLFEDLCAHTALTGGILTVLLADMDGLKHINDTFGHSAGDNAIARTAQALKAACPPDALCVRFGGDEMLAVMKGDHSEEELRSRYNLFLDNYNSTANNPYTISASLGIYKTHPGESLDFENLVKKSDELMYKEKQRKKNRRMN